jgi:hypothetical protein
VAILALNLFDTAVDVVAERDGLFWSYISGVTIIEEDKQKNCKARRQGEEQRPPVAFQHKPETVICVKLIGH